MLIVLYVQVIFGKERKLNSFNAKEKIYFPNYVLNNGFKIKIIALILEQAYEYKYFYIS